MGLQLEYTLGILKSVSQNKSFTLYSLIISSVSHSSNRKPTNTLIFKYIVVDRKIA